jgi:hypothetical protein
MGRRPLIVGLLAATILTAASRTHAGSTGDPYEAMMVRRPPTLEAAPDVAFTTLEGQPAGLKDFRGQVVLLGFFTTW